MNVDGSHSKRVSMRMHTDAYACDLHLAQALPQVAPRDALSSSFLYEEWAPQQITELLARLSPRRACITHIAPQYAATATAREPWYGTAYSVSPISEALLIACESPPTRSDLRWPDANPFIPTDFDLVADAHGPSSDVAAPTTDAPAPSGAKSTPGCASAAAVLASALASRGVLSPPSLIHSTPLTELWHKVDRTFRRPKTHLFMDVVAPAAYRSPNSAILTGICLRMINEQVPPPRCHRAAAGVSQ